MDTVFLNVAPKLHTLFSFKETDALLDALIYWMKNYAIGTFLIVQVMPYFKPGILFLNIPGKIEKYFNWH